MTEMGFPEGTVLTCTHEDCGCRLVVQRACHCTDESGAPYEESGATYTCSCGTPMVVVPRSSSAS